jgi:hypothetical protein
MKADLDRPREPLTMKVAREIGDRPPLIVDRDRFGVVHSEQDLDGGINAHVMDKGADCMIACLDAQKQARVALLQPVGVVAGDRASPCIWRTVISSWHRTKS